MAPLIISNRKTADTERKLDLSLDDIIKTVTTARPPASGPRAPHVAGGGAGPSKAMPAGSQRAPKVSAMK